MRTYQVKTIRGGSPLSEIDFEEKPTTLTVFGSADLSISDNEESKEDFGLLRTKGHEDMPTLILGKAVCCQGDSFRGFDMVDRFSKKFYIVTSLEPIE